MSSAPAAADRPDGVALSVGSCGAPRRAASASSAVSKNPPSPSPKCASTTSSSAPARPSQRGVAGHGVAARAGPRPRRRSPRGPRRARRRRRRGTPGAAGRPTRCTSTSRSAARHAPPRPGPGGRSRAPASASAATASPFQAATTLSSRAGCGARRACGEQPGAHGCPARDVVGVAQQLQRRRAVLERARVGDREQGGGPAPSSRRAPRRAGRRPDVGAALDAVGVGVERRGEAALGGAQVAQHPVGGLQGDPPGERRRRSRATSARRRAAAARCRRASSRSAAPPSRRRPSSARSRRRAGRTCRRAPSPRRCPRPSRSDVASPVRAWWRSRNSSTIDGGNFGAPPKPPRAASYVRCKDRDRVVELLGGRRRLARPAATARSASAVDDARAGRLDLVAALRPGVGAPTRSSWRNDGMPWRGSGGK